MTLSPPQKNQKQTCRVSERWGRGKWRALGDDFRTLPSVQPWRDDSRTCAYLTEPIELHFLRRALGRLWRWKRIESQLLHREILYIVRQEGKFINDRDRGDSGICEI